MTDYDFTIWVKYGVTGILGCWRGKWKAINR